MRRILVVDDDAHVCQAIGIWLDLAVGGISGLAALDTVTFDLMIVDVFMPNMRGFESIRVFHQRAPAVPLIAISGYAFSEPEVSGPDFLNIASRLGATRCQRKPFKPSTLLSAIEECMSEAEPLREHFNPMSRIAYGEHQPRLPGPG